MKKIYIKQPCHNNPFSNLQDNELARKTINMNTK